MPPTMSAICQRGAFVKSFLSDGAGLCGSLAAPGTPQYRPSSGRTSRRRRDCDLFDYVGCPLVFCDYDTKIYESGKFFH